MAGQLRHPLQAGDRLRIRLVAGGRMTDSEWVVGQCERPTRLVSHGQALGASATLRIECHRLGPNSTEVDYRLSFQLPGGPLGQLAARFGIQGVLDIQAKQSLRSLRRLLAVPAGRRDWQQAAPRRGDSGPS
jgi:hypothetical protein